ncbi:type VI secretion system baseplate subunit TssF [Pseudoduganella danionis]|uniref:Type VI secretion system baseplate subunit TssF n=1 Tax=Pseudoduganella danionis TaxID=1890295 RepID=A0ABW9SQL5_9BURK|nr:type VI secretion system baseplate subunit TssF [Pseudoduganella danionis]MTW34312.1 type VI secretion system baseplate subunit TssF [Pseudoduganella danionis]
MTSPFTDLLHRYERERIDQQSIAREFAQRFPAEAATLGLSSGSAEHPQTRALLDAISFTNARTQQCLDKSQQQLPSDLLSVIYPQAIRPLPPLTIAHFDCSHSVTASSLIPRGTTLLSPRLGHTRCQFRTVYELELGSAQVQQASFRNQINLPAGIVAPGPLGGEITLTIGVGPDRALPYLRLFIDADPAFAATLRDSLFLRSAAVYLQSPGSQNWLQFQHSPLQPVGFAEDQAATPDEPRAHATARLLLEYFAYPEKYNFFDIALDEIRSLLGPNCHTFTLRFLLAQDGQSSATSRTLMPLAAHHLLTGCTPVVNLFSISACPIYQDYSKSEYVLLAHAQHPADYEIYSVDRVTAVKKSRSGIRMDEYHPYYSLKHGETSDQTGRHWFARRDEHLAEISPGYETRIAFVDHALDPLDTDISTVSVDLSCTNRSLCSRLPLGHVDGDFQLTRGQGAYPIRMLRQPTPPRRLAATDYWRLISHLACSQQSLLHADLAPLKEMLVLHDPVQNPASRSQIHGLMALNTRADFLPYRGAGARGYLFGVRIAITINEDAYHTSGLYLFGQLLDHLFGLSTQLNTFVRLSLRSAQTGKELMLCPARSGYQNIL